MCYFNSIQIPDDTAITLQGKTQKISAVNRPVQSGFEFANWPIIKAVNNNWQFEMAHWEFIAPWNKNWAEVAESRKKITTLNAVGEKLLQSKLYKNAVLKSRCLVLSSGFYEWRHFQPANAKKSLAYPYFIRVKQKQNFFMAGILQPWTDRETGETLNTFAIVTTAANSLMEQIHNTKKRMPTILPENLAEEWLLGNLNEKKLTELATYQLPAHELEAWPIDKQFKTALNPQKERVYEELPEIVF